MLRARRAGPLHGTPAGVGELVLPLGSAAAEEARRAGPKAATLARLVRAGLPVPTGFVAAAEAYRRQLACLGLEAAAREVFGSEDPLRARRRALEIRLGLMEGPIAAGVLEPLLEAWRALRCDCGTATAVRSSALLEDRAGSSFAGQFESFLGIREEADFVTALRACWAALWAPRALRYMAGHGLDPADTAMAVLVQPLVAARCAGGALSRIGEDEILINAAWGLGSAVAQGEVAPDRYVVARDGTLKDCRGGTRRNHAPGCVHGAREAARRPSGPGALCLEPAQVLELARLVRSTEELLGLPVEIEWAQDESGFRLLQARPLQVRSEAPPDACWRRHPRLDGQPAGSGFGTGRARVIRCECELSRVAPGDVLVTRMAGPALAQILNRVSGVVTELGGATSHLAALARERGIPMVLGAHDATWRIPEGALVAVDGMAGVVRWMAER